MLGYIPQTQIKNIPRPMEVYNPMEWERHIRQDYSALMQQKLYMRGPGEKINKAIDDIAETALGVVIAFYVGGGNNNDD